MYPSPQPNSPRRSWAAFTEPLTPPVFKNKWQGLAGLVLFLAASFFFEATPVSGLILCPFRLITGLECAGCGMTRSWVSLAAGHLAEAFAHNPFGPILFVLAVLKSLFLSLELWKKKKLYLRPVDWVRKPLLGAIAIAMILFGIYRVVFGLFG